MLECLRLDISRFQSKGRIILLGDFNAREGKGLDSDDTVGLYGEDMRNSNGSKLIELMQRFNLVLWNCREFCIEPQWTRIMPKLEQHNTRNKSRACFFCECECESVEHFL